MIGKYKKKLYFTNGDAPWQKRNWTKDLSPCTSFCVLDCLLKASGAKTQAQPLYRQARAQGASRRPSSRRGSHQPVPCLTRVGESGLSDSSLLWRRVGKVGHPTPQPLTQTHHGLQRNCGELKKWNFEILWKFIKLESHVKYKQVPTPNACDLHFYFLCLHSNGPHLFSFPCNKRRCQFKLVHEM